MAKYKFFLEFLKDGTGRVAIDEPIGFSSLIWVLKQKEKGHARDVSFNDGEAELKFVWTRNHYLDKLFFYDQMYGFESKVRFIVEIDGVETILGDLDFSMRNTDGLEYFKCKVIQDSNYQTVKRRKETKVDLFSDKDLNGNPITPISTTNILVKAKSVPNTSRWEQSSNFVSRFRAKGDDGTSTVFFHINPCQNLILSDINDSLTFGTAIERYYEDVSTSQFSVLTAKDNLKNIEISIKDIALFVKTHVASGGNGYTDIRLEIRHGMDFQTATKHTPFSVFLRENITESHNINTDYIIDTLNRGETVWILFWVKVRQSADDFVGNTKIFEVDMNISNMNMSISAESTGYNSITKGVRVYDVANQVVKSYSGLPIKAVDYAPNGIHYDNFLMNGNLLRLKTDKPFNVSLDDLSKSLTETHTDYEVNSEVEFINEKGFYRNEEIWFFDQVQFASMNDTYNPEFTINKMSFKYKNYQALKENEKPNSGNTIHGEADFIFKNSMVENKKEVEVVWIRDSFLIDEAREKSIQISKDTSYQNDENIFALHCIKNESDMSFNEASNLYHEWSESLNKLILRSDETLNFLVIGISAGTPFVIGGSDKNAGTYTVHSVVEREIQLTWISGATMTTSNNGQRNTIYTYTIFKENIPYISRSNEDVLTDNLKSPETFANVLYSLKNNVVNYYNEYMATCNLYHKDQEITINPYHHNGECTITYKGKTTKENAPIVPTNPILSPKLYKDMVFKNIHFEDFLEIQKRIRSKRGYFRTIGNDGNPIKAFVKDLKYDALKKELTIDAKGKYEPILMKIVKQAKIITINDETKMTTYDFNEENQRFQVKDDKLFVYDNNRQLLYKPVFYNLVSINGSTTDSLNEFKSRIELLKN